MKALIKKQPLWAYSILAYAISWLILLPELVAMKGNYQFSDRYLMVLNLSSYGPSLATIIVTAIIEGWDGLKALLKRLVQWKVPLLVYLLVFFLFPLILFLGYQVVGIRPVPGEALFDLFLTLVLLAPLNALFGQIILDIGPLGEELGWRGFMLPRLLQHHGDLVSSVILGLVWAFWHLPGFLFPEWRGDISIVAAVSLYPVSTIAIAYVMTQLHHWSKGSVLIAILYHGIVNYAVGYVQSQHLWKIDQLSPLGLELLIIGLFLVTALVFGLLARSLLCKPSAAEC